MVQNLFKKYLTQISIFFGKFTKFSKRESEIRLIDLIEYRVIQVNDSLLKIHQYTFHPTTTACFLADKSL